MATCCNSCRGFRYPAEVIQDAVLLYHCFSLSLREVETILAACGVVVIFPRVQPDKEAGWSTTGAYVTGRRMGVSDSTFWAGGLTSRVLVGKHATTMILDDLHSADNSATEEQCEQVVERYYNTILGRGGRLREHPRVGPALRPAVRRHAEAAPAKAGRQKASRQGVPLHRGKRHYLWRAVDQNGHVLDILVRRRRKARAAKRFFRKLLKSLQYVPRAVVTDKLRRYGAAEREILSPPPFHRLRRRNLGRLRPVSSTGRANT